MTPLPPCDTDTAILYVDADIKNCNYFKRLFEDDFKIYATEDTAKALEIFRKHSDEIGVVMADQRLPNMTGVAFLEKVADLKSSCVCILSTAYADLETAVEAARKGEIYQYVTQPWEVHALEVCLARAVEHYELQKHRDVLLKQKFANVEMLASSDRVLSIATVAVFRNENLHYVGEALKALVKLAEVGSEGRSEIVAIDPSLSWRDLYLKHLNFIRAVRVGLTREVLHGDRLDYSHPVPVKEAVRPITDELGCFEWVGEEPSNIGWPGSVDAMQAEVRPLLVALAALMRDAGIILLSEVSGGFEVKLSSRILSKSLEFLSVTTKDTPCDESIAFAAAVFRLAHAGAHFEVTPEEGRDIIKLKITFDMQRKVSTGEIGWDSLAAALREDDLFWARYSA